MGAIVLDTETTGLDPKEDRIVEIGIVSLRGDFYFDWRFNPGIPIKQEATDAHGIKDADVAGLESIGLKITRIRQIVEEAESVIGACVNFDKDMLNAEFDRCDIERPRWPPLVCVLRTWDIYDPPSPRKLQNAYRRFVDRKGFEGAHGALADAKAARDVLIAQIETFGLQEVAWDQWDPTRANWWGPTEHIIWDGHALMMNVGKHRGRNVGLVDAGYWRWLASKDFPQHVLDLANFCRTLKTQTPEERIRMVTEWAKTKFSNGPK